MNERRWHGKSVVAMGAWLALVLVVVIVATPILLDIPALKGG